MAAGWKTTVGRALLVALFACLGFGGSAHALPPDGDPALAVPGYDPQFPPDLPFDPADWMTNQGYAPLGDPRAQRVPGSVYVVPWLEFPPTLRTEGPNSNLIQTRSIHGLTFESMVQIHPETEEFIPCLATHWKMQRNDDKTQTFTFRIDPRARWSDGNPVTADDVHASWWHRVQEDRNDPSNAMTFTEGYEEPKILDRLTIQVKTKSLNWRLFLYFGGMQVYPARYVRIPGKDYLERYNWRLMPGSGPYIMKPEDLRKGDTITLTRRTDWWAENEPWARNTYNFEKIKYLTIREEELFYEKFKKGEIDWYPVGKAQRWIEEVPKEEKVQKGWIQRRKIYNQAPQGFNGLCFNMRKPPFNDKRVRLAFAHLFNRERLMEKLFFQEYQYTKSIHPGSDWGSGDERDYIHFDPERAEELLDEAGYRERNPDGYLLGPDGNVLEVTLEYANQQWERVWLVVKEDYENAGIRFNLKLVDGATLIKKVSERQFTIHWQPWGALLFPNPETSWRSELADQLYNNNVPGFKNARVDELCEKYNEVFDRPSQKRITREIDALVFDEVPYAFGWHSGFLRILYWDKFGHPDTYWSRIGDQPDEMMMTYWWIDPAKEARLREAMAKGESLPQGPLEVKPWG